MPDLDAWVYGGGAASAVPVLSAEARAAQAWLRISDRPSSIVIERGSGSGRQVLSAQTVRVEYDNSARRSDQQMTTSMISTAVVFGVRDHATVADTDIRRSDRFTVGSSKYEVIAILTPPGEVQAVCQALGAS